MFFITPLKRALLAAALCTPYAVNAASFSQIETTADLSGSILNFFLGGAPSTLYEINLSGTVTDQIGAPGSVGKTLAFKTTVVEEFGFLRREAGLTLGATTLTGGNVISIDSVGDFEPFTSGPGDLNFPMLIIPTFTDTPNAADPTRFDFTFTGDFDFLPDIIGAEFPDTEVHLSVFLDGPLPTRTFEEVDPLTNTVIDSYPFIEGPLSVSRITLTHGKPPAIAPIPLPAGAPLVLGGLTLLGWLGRRRTA